MNTDPEDETAPAEPASGARFRRSWPALALFALLFVPFAVLAARLPLGAFDTSSDLALTELRTRDVYSAATPLVGVYSRYGWNHPGPLLFYVLAVPYRILGSNSKALLAGGLLVNAAMVAAAGALLWRRGREAGLVVGGVAIALLLRALGGAFLWFPWNPNMTVLPMLVLALLGWSIACGDAWLLPFAVAIASFVAQSHIGSALPAASILIVAVVAFAVDARRRRVERPLRTLGITAAVLVACWLPPLVNEFTGGGNLRAIWEFWTSDQPTTGWSDAVRIVSGTLTIPAPWITGDDAPNAFTGGTDPRWAVPIGFLALAIATFVSWRRRDREAFGLNLVALAFIAGNVVAIAGVVGAPYPYLIRWSWLCGLLAWLGATWTLIRVLRARAPRTAVRAAGAVAAIMTVTLVAATTVGAAQSERPDARYSLALDAMHRAVLEVARNRPGPIAVDGSPDFASASVADAVLVRLLKEGVAAGSAPVNDFKVGSSHTLTPGVAPTAILIASDGAIDSVSRDPRFTKITEYDSLTAAQRADQIRLDEEIRSRGWAAPQWITDNPEILERIAVYRQSVRVAAFVAGSDVGEEISRRTGGTT